MHRTRRLVAPLLALGLVVPPLVRAHIAELEATLDTAQEVPAPVNTNPGAGGTGTFVLEDDGTVEATVTYQGLTGAPVLAHIHQGLPGVPGGIITGFGSSLAGLGTAGTLAGTGDTALSAAQQQTLFAGGMYFNIHTATNPGGEMRGQIRLKPGACSCDTAESPGKFKQCVRKALKGVEKAERGEESVKTLRRLVAKSACGKTKAPRKLVACCLPITPAQNIVTDQMCATVKAKQCDRLGGTSAGTGIACSPNPCTVGSPSGAFIERLGVN
jgi:CHRD domain